MDNFRQKQTRDRTRYRSLDGFAHSRQRLGSSAEPLSQNPDSVSRLSSMSRKAPATLSAQRPNSSGGSMLNTTIPSYKSMLLAEEQQRPTKFKKPRKKLTRRKVIKRSILVIVILLLGSLGFVGVRGIDTLDKVFHGNIFSDVLSAFNDKPLKGESSGRVNILLAGDSSGTRWCRFNRFNLDPEYRYPKSYSVLIEHTQGSMGGYTGLWLAENKCR